MLLRGIAAFPSTALTFLEKKVAFEAVSGVLGVFTAVLVLGGSGVVGKREASDLFSFKDLILVAVGLLSGSRFRGGSRRDGALCFLRGVADFCLGSISTCRPVERRGDEFGSLDASKGTIASPMLATMGLVDVGVSADFILEDRAEKKGCSSSLPGDSYAFGIAGTGGTPSPSFVFVVSERGFGAVKRVVARFCEIRSDKPAELRAEL